MTGSSTARPPGPRPLTPSAAAPTSGPHQGEPYWVGNDCAADYATGGQRPEDIQKECIRVGALYPYCAAEKVYRCPTGVRGEMRTYSVGYGMNGCFDAPGTYVGNQGVRVGKTVLMVKKRSEITDPRRRFASCFWMRAELRRTPTRFNTWCRNGGTARSSATQTARTSPSRTATATTGSTSERRPSTIGKQPNPPHNYKPTTDDGLEDVRRMQVAIWGRVGY